MTTKMISTTFGAINYNTGTLEPNVAVPVAASATFTSPASQYGVEVHDDVFYEYAAGVNHQAGRFITYDNHDLRDLLTEGKCLSDAMINVQRMKETPVPLQCFNVPPLRNIVETIIVTNGSLDMDVGKLGTASSSLFKAGFHTSFPVPNQGKLDDQREILYCERRVYGQDRSQEFTSPNEMGVMATGQSGGGIPTRWLNNFLLLDRTVCGEANLVIGPELQIIRMIEVFCHERSNQLVTTANPSGPATELLQQDMQVFVLFPPIVVNVIGQERSLTATEKAVEYSNVFLSNQNPPSA